MRMSHKRGHINRMSQWTITLWSHLKFVLCWSVRFHISLPSLKFTIFIHLLRSRWLSIDSANPSSMQDAWQIWTQLNDFVLHTYTEPKTAFKSIWEKRVVGCPWAFWDDNVIVDLQYYYLVYQVEDFVEACWFIRQKWRVYRCRRHLRRREFGLVLRVKSRLLPPPPVIARAVQSPRHGPVNRHFVKSTAPRANALLKVR